MPALPLDEAGRYVAAAYLVFLVILAVYLAIMASRVRRVERQMDEVEAARKEAEGPANGAGRTEEERTGSHGG